jgi:hypothetical protein
MSFDLNGGDAAPEPFIRQKPQKKRQRSKPPVVDRPKPQPRSNANDGGGLGCALVGLVILTVIVLIGVGLFLPPFSLGERLFGTPYIALNAQSPNAGMDGLTIAVDPANPGNNFNVRIRAISPDVFLGRTAANQEDAAWIRVARAALPSPLTLLGPVYQIERQGAAPGSLTLTVNAPAGADPITGYDVYRCDVPGNRWQFVPAHPSDNGTALVASVKTLPDRVALFKSVQLVPVISTVIDVGQAITPGVAEVSNVIHPSGLQPTASGTLQGVLPAGIELGQGYAVIPVIRNFTNPAIIDVATITGLLQNSGLRAAHVERLVEFASSKPYQGLAIDYRRLTTDQRDNFTSFITALAGKLHNANLTLTVVVPFPAQNGNGFDTGPYDWRAIGAAADSVELLLPLDPQTFVEKGLVSSVLSWAVGEINRARLQIGLSLFSVQETGGAFTPIAYADALAPLGRVAVQPGGVVQPDNPVEAMLTGYTAQFVPGDSVGTPAIKYYGQDGTLASTMWLTTGAVIRSRLERGAAYNLAGVLTLDLAAPGISTDGLAVISAYKVNLPTDAKPGALALRWTVLAQGTLVNEATGVPGTPFIYKPGVDRNTVAINAEVIGAQATLGPVFVQVASATPSPSITPSLTPTVAPTSTLPPTSTPKTVIIVTATKAADAGSGYGRLVAAPDVDLAYYSADPLAGDAMTHPGGVCPACGMLSQVSH